MNWYGLNRNGTSPYFTEYGEARGFSKIDSPRFKKNKQFFNGLVSHTKNQNPRLGMLLCICLAIN
jgi:hypothetical protein